MSQRPTCATGCTRPTRDVFLLCDGCRRELDRALKELPDHLIDLHDALTQQVKLGEGLAVKLFAKAYDRPLPFNVAASDLAATVRLRLRGWVMDIHETHGEKPLPANNPAAMAKWLRWRMDLLAAHPAALEIFDEITEAYNDVRRLVDIPPTRARFEVGPCPETDPTDGAQCQGQVWAYFPTDPTERARMQCRECGTSWLPEQWYRAGRRIRRMMEDRAGAEHLLRQIFEEPA